MSFSPDEDAARQLDAEDPLRRFRNRFPIPVDRAGQSLSSYVEASIGLTQAGA